MAETYPIGTGPPYDLVENLDAAGDAAMSKATAEIHARRLAAQRDEMDPAEFKDARHRLGLSANRLAKVLRVGSGRTVQRWEAGERDIPGPVIVLIEVLLKIPGARKMLGLGALADD